MIPVEIEHARLKLALAIPGDASMTSANDAIEIVEMMQLKRLLQKKTMTC